MDQVFAERTPVAARLSIGRGGRQLHATEAETGQLRRTPTSSAYESRIRFGFASANRGGLPSLFDADLPPPFHKLIAYVSRR